MTRVIQGFVMVDAEASALNNAGTQPSERTDNIVRTKMFWRGRQAYPYVSGQAWRYWWRTTLAERKNWELSPINREKKIAYTEANPLKYPDDDIFGYMRAPKKTKAKIPTLTRISVLKNSPLISIGPHRPTADFGTFSRLDGDPVPFEHEYYSTVLKGLFSLDIESAGLFKAIQKAGSQNLPEDYKIPEDYSSICEKKGDYFILSKKIREQRIRDVIEVIPYIAGGAMQARHLTRVAPSLVVIGCWSTGSHLLAHLGKSGGGLARLSVEALSQILEDYSEDLCSKVYIGREIGFLDAQSEEIESFAEKNSEEVVLGSVAQAVRAFAEEVPALVE